MSDAQETLRLVLEKYRDGRAEAPYTVSLLEGLHAQMSHGRRKWLFDFVWAQVRFDFEKAVRGERVQHWIFEVAIPFWAKLGDTAVLTKRLLELLVPQEPGVEKAWATHISGQLCHALGQYSNRFADSTITRIETFVGELKFAASTQLEHYRLDPDLGRALHRINQIITDRRFEPVEKNLLAARNAMQSSAKLEGPPALGSGSLVLLARDYSDPIPANIEEIDKDIDYWIGQLGAGEPGSNHEYWVEVRLTKLRHARTRLLENKTTTHEADREFALLALEEARKSVAEKDERIHPKVGAVVVKEGRVLARAHRGEFLGCHAEYVALEKKLADMSVSGATVYTTLEPCTSRIHPKVPCASRLVERKVARVVIGMVDPNPTIRGKGQWTLRRGHVAIDFFPPDLMDEVEELNREFTRLYERDASRPGSIVDPATDAGHEPELPVANDPPVAQRSLQTEFEATRHLHRLRIESEFQKVRELWKRIAVLKDAFWAIPKPGFAFVNPDKEKQHAYHVETSQQFIKRFSEARDFVTGEVITIPKDIADVAIDLPKVAQEEVMQAIQYPDPFEANAMALFNEKARVDFFDARSKNLKEFSTKADKLESIIRQYMQGSG